jgi:hypothetical protein
MGDYQGRSTIVFVFFFLDYTTWLVFRFEGRIVVVPLLLGVIDDQSQTAWTSLLTGELGGLGLKRGERERL